MFRALLAAFIRSKEALIVTLLSLTLAASPAVAVQFAETGASRVSPSVQALQDAREEQDAEDDDEDEDKEEEGESKDDDEDADEPEGCGWLIGGARGDAHQVLMSAWQRSHQGLKGYMSKSADVDRSQRAALRGTIEAATAKLVEIRNEAIADLREQADTFADGDCPELDATGEGELVDAYEQIVDAAIAEMEEVADAATAALDELVGAGAPASPSASGGKGEGKGEKEGKGKPEGAGR
jgi:hypothetical protein